MEVRDLVGIQVDHLFLAGLVDGRFPACSENPTIFDEKDQALLNSILKRRVLDMPAMGGQSPLSERQAEESLLFHLALCSARSSVTLCWSRTDAQGKQNLVSRFIEEVRRIPGATLQESRPRSLIPRAQEARHQSELLTRTSLEKNADPAFRASLPDNSFNAQATWEVFRAANPRRIRSLEQRIAIEKERFQFFASANSPPGRHCGNLSTAMDVLGPRFAFDSCHPLSPKKLSEWGTCRFKGFVAQVLAPEVERETTNEPDPSTLGELAHRALHGFLQNRIATKRLPLLASEEEFSILQEQLHLAATSLEKERPVGHPALWKLALEDAWRLLTRVVEKEASSPHFEGVRPQLLETTLGKGPLPILLVDGPEGNAPLYVSGRADRIDCGPHLAVAIDYKLSRADGLQKRLKESFLKSEFQLAIYAAALHAAWKLPVDGAWISLRDAQPIRLSQILLSLGLDPQDALAVGARAWEAARERPETPTLGKAIWEIAQDIRQGFYPIRPLNCDLCGYGAICRIASAFVLSEV
jgi:RecB family exonuclease